MKIRVAINGFGRIGRNVLRAAQGNPDVHIVAINDLTNAHILAHLFTYDSLHGKFKGTIEATEDALIINGQRIQVLAQRDPAGLPWQELGIDVVVEATGIFLDREGVSKHIFAGAKKVIITAPAKNEDLTVVMGVNHSMYNAQQHHLISSASCTTNCLAPLARVLHDELGIVKGTMTTIHSYTNDQKILDHPHHDLRRARAANLSMIPTTTGAARAIHKVIPELEGRLDGFAIRVPTPNVSVLDLVVQVQKKTTVEMVNAIFTKAANTSLKNILAVSNEPLVSVDYVGNTASSIVDSLSTMVMAGDLVKVLAWYDNELGYSTRVVDLIKHIANHMA